MKGSTNVPKGDFSEFWKFALLNSLINQRLGNRYVEGYWVSIGEVLEYINIWDMLNKFQATSSALGLYQTWPADLRIDQTFHDCRENFNEDSWLRGVIAAADGAGMAMVFTGMRHFRH